MGCSLRWRPHRHNLPEGRRHTPLGKFKAHLSLAGLCWQSIYFNFFISLAVAPMKRRASRCGFLKMRPWPQAKKHDRRSACHRTMQSRSSCRANSRPQQCAAGLCKEAPREWVLLRLHHRRDGVMFQAVNVDRRHHFADWGIDREGNAGCACMTWTCKSARLRAVTRDSLPV